MPVINETVKAAYHTCSMMTGSGMKMDFGGSFGMAWLGIVFIFFVIIFSRKWLGEEMGVMPYNIIGGFVGGFLPYFLIVTFTCSTKFALVIGLVGSFAGAYLASIMLGESE